MIRYRNTAVRIRTGEVEITGANNTHGKSFALTTRLRVFQAGDSSMDPRLSERDRSACRPQGSPTCSAEPVSLSLCLLHRAKNVALATDSETAAEAATCLNTESSALIGSTDGTRKALANACLAGVELHYSRSTCRIRKKVRIERVVGGRRIASRGAGSSKSKRRET